MTIRPADPARDAAACAEIYAPFVRESVVSFEERVPDADDFAARIARTGRRTHGSSRSATAASPARLWRAAPRARGVPLGGGRERYVDPAHHGLGIGRALYEELFERLRGQRLRIACAGITLPNAASVGLHEALGFELVGIYRGIGWKAGAWRDVGWWQLRLLADGDAPPPEPLPPRSA